MNKTMTEASLFNSEKNTLPVYANLGMGVINLLLLLFYRFLKLKKRVANNEVELRSMRANNEVRLQSMRQKIDRMTEL